MTANDKKALSRRQLVKAAGIGAVALGGAGTAVAAPVPRKWDLEADVLVLGFGGAGACAAIGAHDAGAKVLILEKQAEAKHIPSTRMSSGIWHSPDKDGDPQARQAYVQAMFSGDNVPGMMEGDLTGSKELAEVYSREVVNVIDFLKSLDPDFKPMRGGGPVFTKFPGAEASKYRGYFSSYTGKVDFMTPTFDKPKSEKMFGEALFACMLNGVTTRKIAVQYETPAKRLVTNDKGEVLGVIALQNGKEITVKAKRGVIITTGGYAWGAKMRHAFLTGPDAKGWAFWGTPAGTGDGIEMGLRVGAAVEKMAKCAGSLTLAAPLAGSEFKIGIGTPAVANPGAFMVDGVSRRYADEAQLTDDLNRYHFYQTAAAIDPATALDLRTPSWVIFDDKYRAARPMAFIGLAAAGFGLAPWSKDNLDAVERGWILKADSIEELAAKIKAHPDNRGLMDSDQLAKTAARFNEMSAKGADEDFKRRSASLGALEQKPFYAAPLYLGGPNTKGGLRFNVERQVLDWDDKPIARLYAAGEVASCYKHVYQSGGNLAEGIIFGRIAGQNAAKQKAWG
jgi:succinate dehydrogenase/fumarate reductase flavoprotein subunit